MRDLSAAELAVLRLLTAAAEEFDTLPDCTEGDADTHDYEFYFRALRNILYARPAFEDHKEVYVD